MRPINNVIFLPPNFESLRRPQNMLVATLPAVLIVTKMPTYAAISAGVDPGSKNLIMKYMYDLPSVSRKGTCRTVLDVHIR